MGDDCPVTGDYPGGMPATGETAGMDGLDVQGRQGLVTVPGLGYAGCIQGRVFAADEALYTGFLDLTVSQEKYQAVSLRVCLSWIVLHRP